MTRGRIRVAIGQMDCVLGDVTANLERIEAMAADAESRGCDLIVYPELAMSGYAVGPGYSSAALHPGHPIVERLQRRSRRIALSIGFIEETEDAEFFNSAMYLDRGHVRHVHRKVYLPNYRIFDERRYFGAGRGIWGFDTPWCRMAILVCGDMWHMAMPYLAAHDGADVLLVMAASSNEGLTPEISVRGAWERMNQSCALTLSNFVVFANRVGIEQPSGCAEDLAFWGGSHVCAPDGRMMEQAAIGTEDLLVADLDLNELRHQRLILPFRRDDSLAFTLAVGRRIMVAKSERRDGLLSIARDRHEESGDPAPFETDTTFGQPPTPSSL